ncbi:ATP-binding protein [Kitasatospora cineracea]|uniref:AAA+ ATPase domain-containing protein n=1 Tax=Kitasatospora cineracea TaxID=88074 RepID=A0A3N4SI95_9ACTN|nr:ATP-binding protein [Kitasatospora cineracea]RPE36234.1 hypothetical protein EDD38_4603 [Kitasatospora cineracea]
MVQINTSTGSAPVYAAQNGNVHVGVEAAPVDLFARWERALRLAPAGLPIGPDRSYVIERAQALEDLTGFLSTAPPGSVLLVRGESGTGKSVLALRAVDALRAHGHRALAARLPGLLPRAGGVRELIADAIGGAGPDASPGTHRDFLLLDGAEAVQEGCEGLLEEVLDAALLERATVVLVSRDDAVEAIRAVVRRRPGGDLAEHAVPRLGDRELDEVLCLATALRGAARDPRTRWLLGRPKILSLLLVPTHDEPGQVVRLRSEADVFEHVWRTVVRNRGIAPADGVTAESCEDVLTAIARAWLTGRPVPGLHGPTVAHLRSNGLLAPPGTEFGDWEREYHFGHDLVRDYAAAKCLLLKDGMAVLSEHAPRWAVNPVRIWCQSRLDPAVRKPSLPTRWREVRTRLEHLSRAHGSRWTDVGWEAVLSAGWCGEALDVLTDRQLSDTAVKDGMLRCAVQRFGDGYYCDPVVLAPVVEWLARHTGNPFESIPGSADLAVLGWLRSVHLDEWPEDATPEQRRVRALLRDALLDDAPAYPTRSYAQALALLGSDHNEQVTDVLRRIARTSPTTLDDVVEGPETARSLADSQPALLAELALACYLPAESLRRPHHSSDDWHRRERHLLFRHGRGMRSHWSSGPFHFLLHLAPGCGLDLIGALVAGTVAALDTSPPERTLTADLLGLGERSYMGPGQSWRWYRGGLDFPQPCGSALMALERWLNRAVEESVCTVRQAAVVALDRVGTLAGAGLAFGLLLRRLPAVTDELDAFLALPGVWDFEFARYIDEQMHRGTPTDTDEYFLRAPLKELVLRMTYAAGAEPADRDRLRAVADRLRAAAEDRPDRLTVLNWADHLDWQQLRVLSHEGRLEVTVGQPEELARNLEPQRLDVERMNFDYALINRYALHRRLLHRVSLPAVDVDAAQLAADLAAARALASAAAEFADRDGIRAVAAAAVRSSTDGTPLDGDDLRWAAEQLIAAVHQPAAPVGSSSFGGLWGGTAQAAMALPALLGAAGGLAPHTLRAVLVAAALHPVVDVRSHLVEGLRPTWSVPCAPTDCHHQVAWAAVAALGRAALEDARSDFADPWDDDVEFFEAARRTAPDIGAVRLAVVAALDAGAVRHCRTGEAVELRTELLTDYVRCAHRWGDHSSIPQQTAEWGAAVLRAAGREPELLVDLVDRLVQAPSTLAHLFAGMKAAATYESELLPAMAEVWAELMEVVLTAPPAPLPEEAEEREEHGHDRAELLGELVPNPVFSVLDRAADGTFEAVRRRWVPLARVADLLEQWADDAAGRWDTADNLVAYLRTLPDDEQNDPGLRLVRQLSVSSRGTVTSAGLRLADWLAQVHAEVTEGTRPHFQALVDGLAASRHHRAVELQRLDE